MSVYSEWVVVTPEKAAELLENNGSNRPLKPYLVKKYAKLMKTGKWDEDNPEAIMIHEDGSLGNGQHRLTAVRDYGLTIRFYFTYGVKKKVFSTLDTGKNRDGADALALSGFTNASIVASAVRWILGYRNAIKQSITFGHATKSREWNIVHQDIVDFVAENPTIQQYAGKIQTMLNRNRNRLISSIIATAIGFEASQYITDCTREEAEEKTLSFFRPVILSIRLEADKPQYALFQRLLSNSQERRKMKREEISAIVIKAYNAWLFDKPMRKLLWADGEVFPQIASYSVKDSKATAESA